MNGIVRLITTLAQINRSLGWVFRHLSWIFLALMTLFIVTQVFFRKVLNSSLFWPEDVSLMMMIWVAFAVAPIAYRQATNVALDTVTSRFRGPAGQLLQLFIHTLILLMLIMLINEAITLIGRTKIRANTIPISMKYIYMIMPIGFAAMILVSIELLLRNLLGLVRPTHPEAALPNIADQASSNRYKNQR